MNYFIILFILIGVVLRMYTAQGELWLDEVWSINEISLLENWYQVYTSPKVLDGHSSLYSVYLWFAFSPFNSELGLRAPSVIMSIGLLFSIVFQAPQENNQRVFCSFYAAFNYVLMIYGSEARGYSGALFFGFLAWLAYLKLAKTPSTAQAAWWVGATIACFLFHYSFIFLVTALLAAACTEVMTNRAARHYMIAGSSLIMLVLSLIYLLVIKQIPPPVSPPSNYFETLINTLSVFFNGPVISAGNPQSVMLGFIAAALSTVVIIFIIFQKQPKSHCVFYTTLFVVAPLTILTFRQVPVLFPRYFLSIVPFLVLGFSKITSKLLFCPSTRNIPGVFFFILFLTIGSFNWNRALLYEGRGGFKQALLKIMPSSKQTLSTPVIAINPMDIHSAIIIPYYAKKLNVQLNLHNSGKSSSLRPTWFFQSRVGSLPFSQTALPTFFTHSVSGLSGSSLQVLTIPQK
jgi:hypothetical protein